MQAWMLEKMMSWLHCISIVRVTLGLKQRLASDAKPDLRNVKKTLSFLTQTCLSKCWIIWYNNCLLLLLVYHIIITYKKIIMYLYEFLQYCIIKNENVSYGAILYVINNYTVFYMISYYIIWYDLVLFNIVLGVFKHWTLFW